MAQPLTASQRAQIRLYCGYSARFRQTDSRLEQAMNALDVGDIDTFNEVLGFLASLADMDAKLLNAHNRLKAMKVGSIMLDAKVEIGMLRSEGRRFVGRLASTLGVEVRQDVFAGSGPSQYAASGGPRAGSGRGNLLPRG